MHFSLFRTAPGEPSRGRAGTWQRQVQSKAAPPCREVAVNANQRDIVGSHGQEGHAGLALLDGDGPASPMRRHGHPAGASVQTRSSTKHRTALSNQAHNMPHRPDEQGMRHNLWLAPQTFCEVPDGQRQTANLNRAKTRKETAKDTVLEMRSRRIRRTEHPSGGSPLTIGTGSLFSIGPGAPVEATASASTSGSSAIVASTSATCSAWTLVTWLNDEYCPAW